MTAGVLLTVAGIWVLAQVLGGNALGRLGIAGEAEPVVDKRIRRIPRGD